MSFPVNVCESRSGQNKIKVRLFPQDPSVGKDVVIEIAAGMLGHQLNGERVQVIDRTCPLAAADADGNYLFDPQDPRFDQVQAMVVASQVMEMHEGFAGHALRWPGGGRKLALEVHFSESRKNTGYSLMLGGVALPHYRSERLGKWVQTAQSTDIVAHEVSHAVAQGVQPLYDGRLPGLEANAFTESFSDCSAMLYVLTHESQLESLLAETGGDLDGSNQLSKIVEELGEDVCLEHPESADAAYGCVRDANNSFRRPAVETTLPTSGKRDEVIQDAHSYSKIFLGAFYDLIKKTYAHNLQSLGATTSPSDLPKTIVEQALKNTGNTLGPILFKAVEFAPAAVCDYKTIALAMLTADQALNAGQNREDMVSCFQARGILQPEDLDQLQQKLTAITKLPLQLPPQDPADFLERNQQVLHMKPEQFYSTEMLHDSYGITTLTYLQKEIVYGEANPHSKNPDIRPILGEVYGSLKVAFSDSGQVIAFEQDTITPEQLERVQNPPP